MLIADITNPLAPSLTPRDGTAVSLFSSVLGVVIKTMFVAGFVLFMIYFILSAFTWITSSGDAKGVEKARNGIVHALLGMVVMLSLFAILRLLESVFGIDLLQIDLGKIKL